MTIRSKLACLQGFVLLMAVSLVGTSFLFLNNSITPLIKGLEQSAAALSKVGSVEQSTLMMTTSRRDMEQATAMYVQGPNEMTKVKYRFLAKKLQRSINGALRNSIWATRVFDISVAESNLERIERNVFRFIDQGEIKRAKALLRSAEYEVLRENYDAFINQLAHINKASAGDQFSKVIVLSSDIQAGRQQLSVLIPIVILSLASIVLTGFLASNIISRSISRPLKRLAQGAKIIGSGNLQYKTAIGGKDEVGELSRSFDEMTERLQATMVSCNALEREVIERKQVESALHNKNLELEKLLLEHQQVEMALRASEDRLHRFVAEAPIGLVVFDRERRVLRANKAFCELTGYDEDELVGRTYAHYTYPDDLHANVILTDQFYRGERTAYALEKRYIRKSGEIIWVSVNTTGVELADHPSSLQLAAVQDITEQKRAKEAREQLSQDLHDHLLQSLYAVGMQLEAGKQIMGKSIRRSKAYMTHAIDQLNHQVREIRQFIRSLKQQSPLKNKFSQALRQLIASCSATNHVAPSFEIEDATLSVITPTQGEHLLSIIREALSNSIRHAQATHCSVRLSHRGTTIRLMICDDGVGFSPNGQPHRGYGLANMSARAKKIHGRCTVDSAPGKGTCITVEVPMEQGDGQT